MMTSKLRSSTLCVHRPPVSTEGFQSFATPVYRASTIVFPDLQSYRTRASRSPDGYVYGLMGTPTTRALELQLTALAGGVRSIVVPSGQAAISVLMLSLLSAGDHVLLPDSVYPPVRQLAMEVLARCGIEATVYDSMDLQELERGVRPGKTRLIWMESPGSTSMEVCDIRGIVRLARAYGIQTGCDNTWATALNCKPIALGVDFVAEALTKYVGGHSDILLGSITFSDMVSYAKVRRQLECLGIAVSPDECSLALRGLETMSVRLKHVQKVALDMAERMTSRPEVEKVLHPALPDCLGHENWKRDYQGSSGVFTVKLKSRNSGLVDLALGALRLFAIGASWGGTRSLVAPMSLEGTRSHPQAHKDVTYLRISVGLEDPDDLWEDLERMLMVLRKNDEP